MSGATPTEEAVRTNTESSESSRRSSGDQEQSLQLIGLSKEYGTGVAALRDLNLEVAPGEFLTLLGESGSGKSTTLLLIAGFERPTSGQIRFGGQDLVGVPAHRRNMGMVFQNYALFPHMTVRENVAFPLRMRGEKAKSTRSAVDAALQSVHLESFADRYPAQLSGGQQQRVALARATVYRPPVLLMDEPLSALDTVLRRQLQDEIRSLHRSLGTTVILVTHDKQEALALSDRVALMKDGTIHQVDSPVDLYARPRSAFAASFLGTTNFFAGVYAGNNRDRSAVRLDGGPLVHGVPTTHVRAGDRVLLAVRPPSLRVTEFDRDPTTDSDNGLSVVFDEATFLGDAVELSGRTSTGERCVVHTPAARSETWMSGEGVKVTWAPEDATILPSR